MAIARPVSEAEVVRGAQSGDRAAFERLYEQYLPRIFDYALGMLRNRADAEDVTSETFLRAVERLGELRDAEAFKGWLYTIARNAALRIVDARKRSVPVDDHNEDAAAFDGASLPVPGEAAEYSDMRELFDAAASTLSEKERTVYELSVRHGLGSAEIGRVLGVRPAYAYILVNRLKASVTEAAEAVALSRVGGGACTELATVLAGADPLSSRGRKAIARHARACEVCAETKRRRASLPAMMQGTAFAQPGHEFGRELSQRIDAAWSGVGGGAAAGAGPAAVVGAIAAVFIVAVGLVAGAAQRTIVHHEAPARKVLPALSTPVPTAAPTDAGAPGPASVVGPEATPGTRVTIVNSGNSGVSTGTSSSSNSSSEGTGTEVPHETPPPSVRGN
jgi:RNA polymerase sigma factor (sigma-70 family)